MMGESAGRSPQHRQRGTARRRFSPEERAANTPLPDDPEEWPDEPKPRRYWREVVENLATGLLVLLVVSIGLGMAVSASPIWQGVGVALIVCTGTSGWFLWLNERRRQRAL